MINLAMYLLATGIVAFSFECVGAALVFFGVGGLLIRFAS
jgi:predicted membrane-bound spermidine synthase